MNALDKLEAFASLNGCKFYGLPPNSHTLVLKQEEWKVPETYEFGKSEVVPMQAGCMLKWKPVLS